MKRKKSVWCSIVNRVSSLDSFNDSYIYVRDCVVVGFVITVAPQ